MSGGRQEKKHMKKKITVLTLSAMFLALCFPVSAQQPTQVPRIGYLSTGSPSVSSTNLNAFRQGLRDLGYIEGKNIALEIRWAEGSAERVPDLALELVRLKIDVLLVGGGTATALRVKKVTNTVPVVFTLVSDPVGDGLVASLARPGGNLTGLSSVSEDLVGKRLELLKETIRKLSRVAVLLDPKDPANVDSFKEIEAVGKSLGVRLQALEVRRPDEIESAVRLATRAKAGGVLVLPTSLLVNQRKRIAELAINHRLPTMFATSQFMDAGGLMSYGPDHADLYRRAATYVDKILKGAKPADLPVERPMKFEFVINLKTAKQIGLTIPPNVLARADKVMK
jgi:putative tryptophan/tyrosine transport system substrate-binding protein